MATVQIVDMATQEVEQTLPQAIINDDGRIQFKTTKGVGYLVCRAACEAQGIDPVTVAMTDCGLEVYYKIDQPMHGVLVKIKSNQAQPTRFKLNPEWKRYNDCQNEGGEGYVPDSIPKYIDV